MSLRSETTESVFDSRATGMEHVLEPLLLQATIARSAKSENRE